MTDYVPGALGALFDNSGEAPADTSNSTVRATRKRNAVASENVAGPKKVKVTKQKVKKPKKEKENHVEEVEEAAEPTPPAPSDAVMLIKKKPVENAGKEQRQAAKLKKKKVVEAHAVHADREIFIGNVSADVSRKEIQKLFSPCGAVDKVWSRSVLGLTEKKTFAIARKFKKTGNNALNQLNFYIRFKSAEGANKALEMNGVLLKDKHIRVSFANKTTLSSNVSVFVSNIPFDITEEELYKHFKPCGDVNGVRLVHDKYSGLCKGIAYIEFGSQKEATEALKLNESELRNRQIRVQKVMKRNKVLKEKEAYEQARKTTSVAEKNEANRIKQKISNFVVQKSAKKEEKKVVKRPGIAKHKKAKKGAPKSIMT